MMDYTESICFSAEPAEELNRKAFSLDCRLFMFAYYEPKQYREAESKRSQFLTAIVNLYGLFKDCGPFLCELLKTRDSILVTPKWKAIQNDYNMLFQAVTSLRSIFCHNNSLCYPLNEDILQRAENSISEYLPNAPDIEDITETQWTILLQKLCTAADDFFQELSSNMNLLVSCKDVSRKNRIITRWITAISSCYLENPDYLLNAMAGMYQLYLLETGGSFDPSKTLRQQTRYWLRTCCGASGKTWYAFWLDKSGSDAPTSKVYAIIHDWKNQWAQWNCCEPTECEEAPLPGGDLFRILAQDIYTFAKQPYLGYRQF